MKKIVVLVLMTLMLVVYGAAANAAAVKNTPANPAPVVVNSGDRVREKETSAFVIEDRPTYFLIYDQSGAMNSSTYRGWYQMVKTVYHFPTYKIIEDADQVRQSVRAALSAKPDKEELTGIAKNVKADVLVIVVVHQMLERIETYGIGGWWDSDGPDTYVRTIADADIYAYNAKGDKFAQKKVREYDLKELGNQEHPEDTIKWALAKMLTRMEGKPEI